MSGIGPRVGEFELQEPLARGSMGQVWRARHVLQDTPAAVKFIVDPDHQLPEKHDALRAEVRAVAALNHPNIVTLYDYGTLSEGLAAAYPELIANSPYLVMELAPHGALHQWLGALSWPDLSVVLRDILEGLAHAHARGLVHCDLKPENVLLFGPEHDICCKLTDFGIAHAFRDGQAQGDTVRGTPSYMAPEQFTTPADRGPWTDLYALGIIAWEAICRQLPFAESSSLALAVAHTTHPRPPLRPAIDAPSGVASWVARLMALDWRDRFQSAAEARWALDQLTPAGGRWGKLIEASGSTAATLIDAGADLVRSAPLAPPLMETPAPIREAIPCPQDWRSKAIERTPGLLGVGLALYGLRPVPFVGRDAEMDRLWANLCAVHRHGATRAVVIRGGSGTGKSRLALRLAERAHEVGAAEILDVRHARVANPATGLDGMLVRWVRPTGDLSKDAARVERMRGGQDQPDFWSRALAALANPTLAPDPFQASSQRYFALMDLLLDAHAGRPFVIRIDDAQWGLDAVDFALELLRQQRVPALVVVTVRDDALPAEGHAAERITRLAAHEQAETLNLAPLDTGDHRALIEQLLPLEPEVVDQVAARTDGNPLFAVQLVGDWVDRGLLRSGPFGFELPTNEMPQLPASIHALWLDRLAEAVGPSGQRALELGAVLGGEVDFVEWQLACSTASLVASPGLIHDLARRGLVQADNERWSFVHAMLRESLVRLAKEGRRFADHNRACALALGTLPSLRMGDIERIADHFLAADEPARALAHLVQVARAHVDHTSVNGAQRALSKIDVALEVLGAGTDDPIRIEATALRVFVAFSQGDGETAVALLHDAENAAARIGLRPVQAEMLRVRGIIERAEGRLDAAERDLARAQSLAIEGGRPLDAGKACLGRVDIYSARGDLTAVEQVIEQAIEHFVAAGNVLWQTTARIEQARLTFERGDLVTARRQNIAVLADAAHHGDMVNQARAHNNLGTIEWFEGALTRARDEYEAAQAIYRRLDNINQHVSEGCLSLIALAGGDLSGAESHDERCEAALKGTPWPEGLPARRFVRLALACARGDADQVMARARAISTDDPADAGRRMLARAAELALPYATAWSAGLDERVRSCGLALYRTLDDVAGIARLTPPG